MKRSRAAIDPPTIWYMGAKGRVIPGFLDRVLAREAPPGGTVLDLFSGTGIVSAHCARRYRTIANDAQLYAQTIAQSLIEHEPAERDDFLRSLDIEGDLEAEYRRNRGALERAFGPALREEERLLEDALGAAAAAARRRAIARYRGFLESAGALYGSENGGGNGAGASLLPRRARDLASEASIERRRDDPGLRPFCLVAAYYANVYFGLRQAVEIDSLRAAISAIGPGRPFAEGRRAHYLSALIHAASVSTSGTSHFAQPRRLHKDSEILAMARRRRIDILEAFRKFSASIRAAVAAIDFLPGNRALRSDYRALIGENGAGPAFAGDCRADLVYMDPPYTSDNYSRFYHVLESIAAYDYPELERGGGGEVLRGRYPVIEKRFRSGFCSPGTVEGEFERVIRAAAGSGSRLVISYGYPSGLLFKVYRARWPRRDPVKRLEALCRQSFRSVRTRRRRLMHSGQGDSNIHTDELLIICKQK